MNRLLSIFALATVAAPAFAASSTPVTTGCHAALTVVDARSLAEATPNARAFVANYGAKLATTVKSQGVSTASIYVTADDPKHGSTEVGLYTVSLRTGHVTDDDMEPAEDAKTAAVRAKLMARHCAGQ